MVVLGFIFAACAVTREGSVRQQAPSASVPTAKTTGITPVETPQVLLEGGTTIRVVTSKFAFSLAGPTGSTFKFQPAIENASQYESASLQLNGTDVAVGKFSNGQVPVLGYSPNSGDEIVVYRAIGGGSSKTIATYHLHTGSKGLHPLHLKSDSDRIFPDEIRDGHYLVFGPNGLIGLSSSPHFSIDLSNFPSGTQSFETVYLDGDYAECPVVSQAILEPKFEIEGQNRHVTPQAKANLKVIDNHHRGIQSVLVLVNGKRLGEFDDWQSGILLNLAAYNSGIYKVAVFAKLTDGSTLGPEVRMIEVDNDGGNPAMPVRPPAPPPTLNDLSIRSAWYGAVANGLGQDITERIQTLLRSGSTTLKIDNSNIGDTAPGFHKQLTVQCSVRGDIRTLTVQEGETLDLMDALSPDRTTRFTQASPTTRIKIASAFLQGVDVSSKVRTAVENGQTSIPVSTFWFGISDPTPGVRKTLTIVVVDPDGTQRVLTGLEGGTIVLSDVNSQLRTLPILEAIGNGSFKTTEINSFASAMKYVPANSGVLASPGVFTLAPGLMRPYQLHPGLRLDFVQHSDNPRSMAMFLNPNAGRQPVLLWSEKVKVRPNTLYKLRCFCADISDNTPTSFTSIVLEIGGVRGDPVVLDTIDEWENIWLLARTGNESYVTLKIWRDVLPDFADSASLMGIDDITFLPDGS